MDTRTGKIFKVAEGTPAPQQGAVMLEKREAEELIPMTNNCGRLRRWKRNHASEPCAVCSRSFSGHTLAQLAECGDRGNVRSAA